MKRQREESDGDLSEVEPVKLVADRMELSAKNMNSARTVNETEAQSG